MIVDEASDAVRAQMTATTDCKGWKIPRRSLTAAIMQDHGIDPADAQVVRYGQGGSYDWHTDGGHRAETVVVQLTAPAEYEGGDLEVMGWGTAPRTQGEITRFSAQARHKAHEVTKGERWALVGWVPVGL